jgi:glucan phosphoethanolaminetransferase (alkaline phosphatase superfamily)
MRPSLARPTSWILPVLVLVLAWMVSVALCLPASMIAGFALSDALSSGTYRGSGDALPMLLTLLLFAVLFLLVTVGWSLVCRRTYRRYRHGSRHR